MADFKTIGILQFSNSFQDSLDPCFHGGVNTRWPTPFLPQFRVSRFLRIVFGLAVSSFRSSYARTTAFSFLPPTIFFIRIVLLLIFFLVLFLFLLFGRKRVRFWDFSKVGEFGNFGRDYALVNEFLEFGGEDTLESNSMLAGETETGLSNLRETNPYHKRILIGLRLWSIICLRVMRNLVCITFGQFSARQCQTDYDHIDLPKHSHARIQRSSCKSSC